MRTNHKKGTKIRTSLILIPDSWPIQLQIASITTQIAGICYQPANDCIRGLITNLLQVKTTNKYNLFPMRNKEDLMRMDINSVNTKAIATRALCSINNKNTKLTTENS